MSTCERAGCARTAAPGDDLCHFHQAQTVRAAQPRQKAAPAPRTVPKLSFVDAPPKARGGRRAGHNADVDLEVAAQCRANPGRWAEFPAAARWPDWHSVSEKARPARLRLSEKARPARLRLLSKQIRDGEPPYGPGFDAVTRAGVLYVCFTGDGEEEAA